MQDAVFDGANLEQADFSFGDTNLEGAKFMSSNLRGADLTGANLQRCNFIKADMAGATLESSDLQGAIFCEANLKKVDISCANLKSAKFELAKVDADTVLQFCDFDKYTDFTGVGLDAARIQPGLKVALKNNIRRMHWKIWLRKGNIFFRILKNLFVRPFWWMTGYGSSTVSILFWFVGLVFGFAGLYFWFEITGNKVVDGLTVCGMPWYHTCLRAIYFSVVTMTTLGFGDLYALDESYWGHVLLMLQVILGYLLLGALVTRLGILFTNEAPAAGPRSYDSN